MEKILWVEPKQHQTLEISGFKGNPEYIERFKDMGFFVGLRIQYLGRAPFLGPHLVRFSTIQVALREEEFLCLILKPM
jgi:ferrous iron transport protein A